MKTIGKLKAEATKSAVWRKHTMLGWIDDSPTQSTNTCGVCGATVTVMTDPPPNGIDIGGSAVAVNCSDEPTT